MKPHRTALALALVSTFIASAARAGRDESLIQQTRKNQLAHDARIKKPEQQRKK